MKAITSAMKKNKSIKILKFDGKNILCFLIFDSLVIVGATVVECDVEGAKEIAAMLVENDTLIELNLFGENIHQHLWNQVNCLCRQSVWRCWCHCNRRRIADQHDVEVDQLGL